MKCRNCKKKTLKRIIKLGSQPTSSRTHKKRIKLKKYPLDLYECQNLNWYNCQRWHLLGKCMGQPTVIGLL